MAANQLRSSTAAIALICASCFGPLAAHSQSLPLAPSPTQQAAIDANPFFYGENWVISDTGSIEQCSQDGFMQCFQNGYCASHNGTSITRAYKLEAADDEGTTVVLRRPSMLDTITIQPSKYGSNGLLVPEFWSVPVATEHLSLDLKLVSVTPSHAQAEVGTNIVESHDGEAYDAGLPSQFNFRSCSAPPDFEWTEGMKAEAAFVYEIHEALRSIASYQSRILDALLGFEITASGQSLNVSMSNDDLHNFFTSNCGACEDFGAKLEGLGLALNIVDEGPDDWSHVYELVVDFDQSALALADAIEQFVNEDFQAYVATIQAEIEALELAEAQRQQEAEQEQQAAALAAAQARREKQARVERDLEAFYQEPSLLLRYSYHSYMITQTCNNARQGLAYQFINDNDLSRARDAIVGIEALLVEAEPTLDTDAIWADAADAFGDLSITPLPLVAEIDELMAAYVEVTQAQFLGETGAQRRTHFENQVRSPDDLTQIESICQIMGNALSRDLAALEARFGSNQTSTKDF